MRHDRKMIEFGGSIIETKLLINSVIPDAHKGARFMSMDLKEYFLNTSMICPKYMKVKNSNIPPDIKKKI